MEHSRGQRQGSGESTKRNVQGQCFLEEFKEGKAGLSYPWEAPWGRLASGGAGRAGQGPGHLSCRRDSQGHPWVRAWTCPVAGGDSGRSHSWVCVWEDKSSKNVQEMAWGGEQGGSC